MPERLLSPTFLFRFTTPCRYATPLWPKDAAGLPAEYAIPTFGQLEGQKRFADLRMAWHETGLFAQLTVTGKTQTPWCRDSRVQDSDGLSLSIDTRDSHNIHRATRFCHQFIFLPLGTGPRLERPVGVMVPINRARELPKFAESETLRVESKVVKDGYTLRVLIPASALTGWGPADHPRLGFSYAVRDRELGWQSFTMGPEFPVDEDPSLWGTLELQN